MTSHWKFEVLLLEENVVSRVCTCDADLEKQNKSIALSKIHYRFFVS